MQSINDCKTGIDSEAWWFLHNARSAHNGKPAGYIVLSTVGRLRSAGSRINARAGFCTVDKRVHFVYCFGTIKIRNKTRFCSILSFLNFAGFTADDIQKPYNFLLGFSEKKL